MMKPYWKLAIGVALGLTAIPATAAPIVLGSGWQPFSFGAVGSSFSRTFEFTLTGTAQFNVTDAFLDGDQFQIFINSVNQGLTSTPVNDGTNTSNYDTAFASPKFSHASYLLGPGTYSVSGITHLSPYGGGGAAAELVAAVPEPATWAMMLVGFGVIGGASRYRRRKAAVSFA